MNFNTLKIAFLTFLEEKQREENKSSEQTYDINSISIFSYQKEFADYVSKEFSLDISLFSQDISDFTNMDFQNGQFLMESPEISDEQNDIVVGMLNDLMSQESVIGVYDGDSSGNLDKDEALKLIEGLSKDGKDKKQLSVNDILSGANKKTPETKSTKDKITDFKTEFGDILSEEDASMLNSTFDLNKDGVISEEEMNKARESLGFIDGKDNDISKDDMAKIKEYIAKLTKEGLTPEQIAEKIKGLKDNKQELDKLGAEQAPTEAPSETPTESTLPETPSDFSETSFDDGSSSGSSSSSSSSGTNSSSAGTSEKTVSNMSVKELEEELKKAKTEVETARNGYVQELEKANTELAGKIKDVTANIKTTESEIDNANNQLKTYNDKLKSDTQSLQSAEASVGTIDGQISSLKQALNDPNADKASIQAQIAELQAQKNTLKNETIPALQESIQKTQKEIDKLNNQVIPPLEQKLTKQNEELAKYEQEVTELTTSNSDLKTQMDTYNSAVEYQKNVEKSLQARKISQEKALNSEMPRNDEASYDYRGIDGYTFKNLPYDYELGDEVFHCVGSAGYDLDGDGEIDFQPDSWEEIQRYFNNGGVENMGKYGNRQCHNYSDMLGQFLLGDINQEFVQALYAETNDSSFGDQDLAGKMATSKEWNPRRFARPAAANRDEERAIIENELQNGRPAVVIVDGGKHWVLAVGMSDEGDILIWDSYDGSLEKLGRSSNSDSNDLPRDMVANDGVQIYCQDYEYGYSSSEYFDYWSYVGNSPEYILEHGYKK